MVYKNSWYLHISPLAPKDDFNQCVWQNQSLPKVVSQECASNGQPYKPANCFTVHRAPNSGAKG
jgi:hypothetical protein